MSHLRFRLTRAARIGLVLLILANVAHWLTTRSVVPSTGLTDLIQGLLFGTSIALLLCSLRQGSGGCRQASSTQ